MAWCFRGKYRYLTFALICLVCTFIMYKNLPDGTYSTKSERESNHNREKTKHISSSEPLTKDNLPQKLTIVIRQFEDFENKLVETVEGIEEALGPVPILIVADALPYPPIKLNPKGSAMIVTLSSNLLKNHSSACVTDFITTEFILVVPDAVTITDWKLFKSALPILRSKKPTKAVAMAVGDSRLECSGLHVNLREWTVSYRANDSSVINDCPLIKGEHALFMHAETFQHLPEPFARPFPLTFYIQMRIKNFKTRIMKSARIGIITKLYTEAHFSWKHKQAETERLKAFYQTVGIKREISPLGVSLYYGCTRTTPRCFNTVINDMAQYLFEGRWTPPCCLNGIRETAVHVFNVLEKYEVRYWLEGGSLLGAVRNGDIIPWDYDVDVGIYQDDIIKCPLLVKAQSENHLDDDDFVWEKATEGDFFRVQFSEINHLHVDLYPFYSKNGIMTKNTWFPTHRQDTEFPERFLKPLTKIKFIGIEASAPNSVREFLEYKFGEGVIENPRYPNLQKPFV